MDGLRINSIASRAGSAAFSEHTEAKMESSIQELNDAILAQAQTYWDNFCQLQVRDNLYPSSVR